MKPILKKVLIIGGVVVLAGGVVTGIALGVKKNLDEHSESISIPTSGENLDPEVDSWEQIDPDAEDVEVRWWVDQTGWEFYHLEDSIYKRTGVKVKFERALKNDGTELSTMIAGTLPDILTITDYQTRVQLAEEKYVWPLDTLAELYAPSMLKRLSPELSDYYRGSDGHVYALANNFYNDIDVAEYESMGEKIGSNYAILARKDYINAYLSAMKAENASFDQDRVATTPQGFINMCKWVKQHYGLENSNPTVCLSEFFTKASNGSISPALSALMNFFCVPKEDANGNLVYEYGTPEFQEILCFLNDLFNEHLIISSNFGYSSTNVIQNIKNGYPFVVIGQVQNYSTGLASRSAAGYDPVNKTFSDSNEYIPIVLTNSRGDAPVIGDLSGRGLRVSMITKDAKHVDRLIKVFDYMISELGNREQYYGEVEGEYWNYTVRPGETAKITIDGKEVDHVFPYGQIEWTDKAKELLGRPDNKGWYNANLKQMSLLQNPMFVNMTSANHADLNTYQFWLRYDNKCAYNDYVYHNTNFRFNDDISDPKVYNSMAKIQADIEGTWIETLPSIIMAGDNAGAMALYETAMRKTKNQGYERWLSYKNKSFQAYKQSLNMQYAWPKNDPSYVAPAVKLFGEHDKYAKPIPDYIHIGQ